MASNPMNKSSATINYVKGVKALDEVMRQLDDLERTRPSYVTGFIAAQNLENMNRPPHGGWLPILLPPHRPSL